MNIKRKRWLRMHISGQFVMQRETGSKFQTQQAQCENHPMERSPGRTLSIYHRSTRLKMTFRCQAICWRQNRKDGWKDVPRTHTHTHTHTLTVSGFSLSPRLSRPLSHKQPYTHTHTHTHSRIHTDGRTRDRYAFVGSHPSY